MSGEHIPVLNKVFVLSVVYLRAVRQVYSLRLNPGGVWEVLLPIKVRYSLYYKHNDNRYAILSCVRRGLGGV